MIEPGNGEIAVARQCELLALARSSYYYRGCWESTENLELMGRIDEQFLRTPFYGSPRMTAVLKRMGYAVNHKRVERLMRVMGIVAVYPKKKTSQPHPENKIYPYLLSNLEIRRPDQVWGADKFTSLDFTGRLEAEGIRISMDGRGRVFDNIFIERLWRTVKYEEVYLHSYETVEEARRRLSEYFVFYNTERLHSELGYRTPHEVYFGGSTNGLAIVPLELWV